MDMKDIIRRGRDVFSQSPTASVRAALEQAAGNSRTADEAERHLDRYARCLSDCDSLADVVRIEGRGAMLAIFDLASR